jgi:hypothetical protein
MTDKKKRMLAATVGAVVCVALIVGIAIHFGGQVKPASEAQNGNDTNVPEPAINIENAEPEVSMQANTPSVSDTNPGDGADSNGTEQTIQADPAKPEPPESPSSPSDNHDADDVPDEDKNAAAPPSYAPDQTTVTTKPSEPPPGSTNDKGQVFVPGFGWVDDSGANEGGTLDGMYESGDKVGDMG